MRTLLGKYCEFEKVMRFLRAIGMIDKIKKLWVADEISKLGTESYSH